MRRNIRRISTDKLMITIPKAFAEHLNYTRGMPIYIYVKNNSMILSKKEKTNPNLKFDYFIKRKIIEMGNYGTLGITIPIKITLLLEYYPDQEIDIALDKEDLSINKLYGA
jgi:antitoxin component of MazEF toxin-antitoxin module